jgi:hypothetical protein
MYCPDPFMALAVNNVARFQGSPPLTLSNVPLASYTLFTTTPEG